jgi:hypothetical protein
MRFLSQFELTLPGDTYYEWFKHEAETYTLSGPSPQSFRPIRNSRNERALAP